ncbi:hypothetical protein ACNUDN_30270 [Mycobacterium sp. smrl_JER01]|uniref:hypothetical protein n=1 Tax=Mycobacterium sp. smrl_JER01 TaxID=3402633 RepID=UPI003AC87A9C
MTDTELDNAAEIGERAGSEAGTPAPTSVEEASDYLARISAELNERKQAAHEAAQRFAGVEHEVQTEIDDVTRRALTEVRDVQRRVDAEISEAQARLTERVEAASRDLFAAGARYGEAIDKVVASGLVSRKLLAAMGFSTPRSKQKLKPVVSKIKPADLDD